MSQVIKRSLSFRELSAPGVLLCAWEEQHSCFRSFSLTVCSYLHELYLSTQRLLQSEYLIIEHGCTANALNDVCFHCFLLYKLCVWVQHKCLYTHTCAFRNTYILSSQRLTLNISQPGGRHIELWCNLTAVYQVHHTVAMFGKVFNQVLNPVRGAAKKLRLKDEGQQYFNF